MSITNNPQASGTSFTLDMGKDSGTGNQVQKVALTEPSGGTFITPMQQSGGSVTALAAGSVANPTSTLTRPSSAVTATVTFTLASPTVFTWTSNPLVNNQSVVLTGTVPSGATAGLTYYVQNVSGNTFQLAPAIGGTLINATASGSCTAALTYAASELIGSATAGGSVTVPSFIIPNSSNAFVTSRVRLSTNATSGWGGINLSVDLWSAAPTFAAGNGDGQPYNPSGIAKWLGNFIVSMAQYADGAVGAGGITASNALAAALSGASVFWTLSMGTGSAANPIVSQTFTLTPELMN